MSTVFLSPSPRWIGAVAVSAATALVPVLIGPRLWTVWTVTIGLLVLLLAVDAVLAPHRRHLDVELDLPATLAVGAVHRSALRCRTAFGRARRPLARLECSEDLGADQDVTVELGDDPPVCPLTVRPRRRGTMVADAVWLRYTGPLGFARRDLRIAIDKVVEIVPSIRSVRRLALAFANPREQLVGLKIERVSGDGSDFHALRQYMPGMDLGSVDWKATARHRRLLSREFRAERNHHVVLAVDTGRLMAEEIDGLPRLDHTIHAALLLAYMGLRTGDRISLYSFAGTPGHMSSPSSGVGTFPALLHLSAALDYTSEETNFTLGLTHLASKLRRRSLVVVLTDFVDTVTAELMIDNIRRLSRTHLVVFAAMRNPMLERTIGDAPTSVDRIERAVVAGSLARDRRVVLRRLQRAGVLCVDTEPGKLGIGLVRRYLEIKRREMI